jgi:hypothetical protein
LNTLEFPKDNGNFTDDEFTVGKGRTFKGLMSVNVLLVSGQMPALTLDDLRKAVPKAGFFADREWIWSPEPFQLSKAQRKMLTRLGHPLHRFQQASDEIYRLSGEGRRPAWIAKLLDAGKPDWMIAHQRSERQRGIIPRVIRPDLLLTEDGFSASELDAVPGGIGTLGWLSQAYAAAGFEIFGGAKGMLEGFASLFDGEGADILVSEESGDYRPEMDWLAGELGEGFSVHEAESWTPGEREAYRFFELYDWKSIPAIRDLAASGKVTPPLKPHFEEKLWLALFWTPSLRKVWESELRGSHLQMLKKVIPYGWPVDPAEIPPHAAIPRLEVSSWDEVGEFSQKDRRLVLKVSGFSELAWGSRGVTIGHDEPSSEWQRLVSEAQAEFVTQPRVMQEFQETKLIEHPYFDPETGERRIMVGRVRLCPYYFVDREGQTKMGGCLATIVPADKKKIHGMRDGVLVPCM